MKFSNTLAILFIGLGAASPLMVREPQGSPRPSDLLLPSQGDDSAVLDPEFAQPVPPSRGPKNSQGLPRPNDLLPPSQGDDSAVLDPEFAQPVPPSRGPKNSQGFTQENCDNIRNNFNKEFAAKFGC